MRLSSGGAIDRSRPLNFTFDGRKLTGFAGDTLASALIANDVKVIARSFKLHRPRGLLAAGLEEPSALVTVGEGPEREVNLRATAVPLREGLVARSQNVWPSLSFDWRAIYGWFARVLPAGFYHKTFKWPSWTWYEKAIRESAGLGAIGDEADPDRYAKRFHHCDVLVIGAGAAGRAAADEARSHGADVMVVDRSRGMTAIGYYEDNFVVVVEEIRRAVRAESPCQRIWKIRAEQVILATGAIERPLVFENNDLPGIMLASAVHSYLEHHAVVAGRRAVIVTNNDSTNALAENLRAVGVEVAAVVDMRSGEAIVGALGRSGVRGVDVRGADGVIRRIECDVVAMSGGWNPDLHLYSQAGGKLRFDDGLATFVPDGCAQNVICVGAAAGEIAPAMHARWREPTGNARRQWVDFQYDVTVADIELAAREGFVSVEHMKRYTAAGMAPDQGKVGNVNALAILGELTGRAPAEVGTTTFRPPYHPVTIGALAGSRVGALAQRYRQLPVSWHEKNGGVMEDHSGWLRAACYPRAGESIEAAIVRETIAARTHAALFDSSSLGKIEVFGPHAAEFLNRLYVNNVKTLQAGRMRYGMMLSENGIIKDDGVFACLAPDHYLVCTSSAGARDIHFWMEEWLQCEWRDLDVTIVHQTAQWATLTVSGPLARKIVGQLGLMIDLSPLAFPHMQIRETKYDGAPMRVRRASYTGELSYELDVPVLRAEALWRRLLELGADVGITPIGMEALDVLRVEKGFLEVGVDTDGETTPLDCGWSEAIAKKRDDFIGRRSLMRPAQQRKDRLQLVGLLSEDSEVVLPVGAHGLDERGDVIGHVTSSCLSPHLKRSAAMGRVRAGALRVGEVISVDIDGVRHPVRITDRTFLDRHGERLNA